MVQEFVTSTGTIKIENNTIYLRRKTNTITDQFFKEVIIPLLVIAYFILALTEDPSPKRNVRVVFSCLLILLSIWPLLNNLFRRSHSNRIPIQKIKTCKMEDDGNGLEVHLKLRLASGREKVISFRKLENQLEPFIGTLEANQISLEMA